MDLIPTQEGQAEFRIASIDFPCHTYYKIFGDLQSGPPLVVCHGGPGSGHEYCLPFGKLWSLYGVPVVFYDQIGCAASTHLPHTLGDESFWNLDLFVSELENLLDHLGLSKDGPGFSLLGHSWGAKIAVTMASRRPHGLQKLVLVGGSADSKLFAKGLWKLKERLSIESQQAIDEAVKNHDFKTPAYLAALNEFFRTFLCRAADPWPPAELAIDFQHQAEDFTVRRTMQGPSPWVYIGVLSKIVSTPLLPQIEASTIVINGEYDTAQPEAIAPFFEHIPSVQQVVLAGASHMPHLDSIEMQTKTLHIIGGFLKKSGVDN